MLMASESRRFVAGFRKYNEGEIETMIRQMKIEGGTLDDCIAELNILADFVHSQANGLTDAWPDLLKDTYYERWKQRKSETGTTEDPVPKSDVQSFKSEKVSQMGTNDRQGKLERFFKEVADLTVDHGVIAGEAVVYPSTLGEALRRVDSGWYHQIQKD
jgi:hypothetical protein